MALGLPHNIQVCSGLVQSRGAEKWLKGAMHAAFTFLPVFSTAKVFIVLPLPALKLYSTSFFCLI
jgi:hypothetical protein